MYPAGLGSRVREGLGWEAQLRAVDAAGANDTHPARTNTLNNQQKTGAPTGARTPGRGEITTC